MDITNNHVIAGIDDIVVKVDSKEYKAKVVGLGIYGYCCFDGNKKLI